jgi:hypothetical protein
MSMQKNVSFHKARRGRLFQKAKKKQISKFHSGQRKAMHRWLSGSFMKGDPQNATNNVEQANQAKKGLLTFSGRRYSSLRALKASLTSFSTWKSEIAETEA